jgi:uncharacterized cupredoxin-like copper-binding protein
MIRMRARVPAAAVLAALLAVAACGGAEGDREAETSPGEAMGAPSGADPAAPAAIAGSADDVIERVVVRLSEYEFQADRTEFVAGRPYLFVLINAGSEPHEWAVVPRGATDPDSAYFEVEEDELPPGAQTEVVYTFPGAGDYDFACFLPGHYEQGMVLAVVVDGSE